MKKYMLIVYVIGGSEKAEFYDYADEAEQAFELYSNLQSMVKVELYVYCELYGHGEGFSYRKFKQSPIGHFSTNK